MRRLLCAATIAFTLAGVVTLLAGNGGLLLCVQYVEGNEHLLQIIQVNVDSLPGLFQGRSCRDAEEDRLLVRIPFETVD